MAMPDEDLFGDSLCLFNPLPNEWPDGLRFLNGAPSRLCGIEVYHDFVWQAVFDHSRSMFPQGQKLAALIQGDCPANLKAALLLTTRVDVTPGIRVTPTYYIAVVKIHDYLNNPANPAAAYFTTALKASTSGLAALQEIEKHPLAINALVSKHINVLAIEQWVCEDISRLNILIQVLAKVKAAEHPCREAFDDLLQCWATGDISNHQISTLVRSLAKESHLATLVSALAERADELETLPEIGTDNSRRMVASALRTAHRSDAVAELKRLVANAALEEDFQELLDRNWWMLGAQYVEKIDKRHWTDEETLDILLRSASGFFDIIELKRSVVDAFKQDHGKWIVSAAVNDAVNQAAHYISEIERVRDNKIARYHVDLYKLNAIVLVGFIDEKDGSASQKQLALRMYNSHLHRIRVVTFNELIRIAEQVISANMGEVRYAAAGFDEAIERPAAIKSEEVSSHSPFVQI